MLLGALVAVGCDGGDGGECQEYCDLGFSAGAPAGDAAQCAGQVIVNAGYEALFEVCPDVPTNPSQCMSCVSQASVPGSVCKQAYESCF